MLCFGAACSMSTTPSPARRNLKDRPDLGWGLHKRSERSERKDGQVTVESTQRYTGLQSVLFHTSLLRAEQRFQRASELLPKEGCMIPVFCINVGNYIINNDIYK